MIRLSELRKRLNLKQTLMFSGENRRFEKEFKTDYFENNRVHFRYCILISILLYSILSVLDYFVFKEKLGQKHRGLTRCHFCWYHVPLEGLLS